MARAEEEAEAAELLKFAKLATVGVEERMEEWSQLRAKLDGINAAIRRAEDILQGGSALGLGLGLG